MERDVLVVLEEIAGAIEAIREATGGENLRGLP